MKMNKILIITIILIAFIGGIFFGLSINKISQQDTSKKNTVKKDTTKCQENTNNISDILKKENIVFLGDSITDFYPIADIFNDLPIVNSGKSGYKTDDILSRMDNMVYRYNPTKVFLLIGTNDLNDTSEESIEKVEENITKIVQNIKDHRKNAKIYVESIYPVNKSVRDWVVDKRENEVIREVNEYLKNYCEENDCTYIDIYNILKDQDGNFAKKYTTDGLHVNDLGYARISQELAKYLYNLKS